MTTFTTGRVLIDTVADYISKMDRANKVIVIEAPTGYGKSVGAPIIGALNYLKKFSFNFIHVLPLRAIVEDLYVCKYVATLKSPCGDAISCRCRALPPEAFYNALKAMEVNENEIAYQMGFDYMIKGVGVKTPTYDAKVVVSTLDSFAYNFLRMPVTEFFREVKHYATPRARIFTSSIFLDEVHMLKRFNDESSERVLAFIKVLIDFCLKTLTPLVMATATLWSRFREAIKSWCRGEVIFFSLSDRDEKIGSTIYVRDRDFEDHAKSITWYTEVIEEDKLITKISEHVEKGEKVLVVRDTVSSAVRTFNSLDIGEKVLIHGRLCLGDRGRAIERAREAKVVVATPIIEAGVDWDFDVGFRDATNAPSIVQVFGRVCRNRRDCTAHVYLIKTEKSLGSIVEYVKMNNRIDWRIPYSYSRNGLEYKGYSEILERSQIELSIDQKLKELEDTFRALIAPVALPSNYINMVLREYNYSVLKEPLAQFYVYGCEELEKTKTVDEVISGTFTYTLGLAREHSFCVEGFVCVVEKEGEIIVKKIGDRGKPINEREYIYLYKKCIAISSENRGRPIFSGFVLSRDCYRDGLGLIEVE